MTAFVLKTELSSVNCALCSAKPIIFTVYHFTKQFSDPWPNSFIVIQNGNNPVLYMCVCMCKIF